MDNKVIFYILIAIVYYGYQAYKKMSDSKKTTEFEPLPEENKPQIPYPTTKKVIQTYFEPTPIIKEYELKSIEQGSEIAFSNAFNPTQIEQGIIDSDLIPASNYAITSKVKYNSKSEIKSLLNSKKQLKAAFVFNEIMQRKF